jgi:hypothetical protein
LRLKDGIWIFDETADLRKVLVKPFLSNHLNEALNPSIFSNLLGLRSYVRRTVKRQSCAQWLIQYPNLSQTNLNETLRALRLWNGEDYGFTESRHFITISNTCFNEEDSALQK